MRRLPLLLVLALLLCGAPAAAEVDLVGTWHVLVHYKDPNAGNPEAERWVDRVWVFAREEERLRWTDYPIVVLEDETGRFERSQGHNARVLAYWTPTEGQMADLRKGPKVNSRGSKSKTLRGSDAEGWASGAKRQRSMAFVSYEEKWSIEEPASTPTFVLADTLGGGAVEDSEGATIYKGLEVKPSGKEIRGEYERDATKKGTFVMRKVGDVRFLDTKGLTPNEKAAERAREEYLQELEGGR